LWARARAWLRRRPVLQDAGIAGYALELRNCNAPLGINPLWTGPVPPLRCGSTIGAGVLLQVRGGDVHAELLEERAWEEVQRIHDESPAGGHR
jgi:hypothetical protein